MLKCFAPKSLNCNSQPPSDNTNLARKVLSEFKNI